MQGQHKLQASVNSAGRLGLRVDENPVADEVDCPLLSGQPVEGLLVGRDE